LQEGKFMMNLVSRRTSLHMAGLLVPVLSVPVTAHTADDWSYSFAPYVFALGLKGDIATLPPAGPAEVDIPFSDIWDHLDIALMGVGEARKGRFGLWGDLFYSRLSADADTPGRFFSGADYEQTLSFITAGGSWRMVESSNANLDMIAALRYSRLDNELDLDDGTLPGRKVEHDEDWVDPLIGVKGKMKFSNNWFVSGWAFGAVGGDSDSAYDLFGGLGYAFSDSHSLVAGYRHLEVDYENGDFLFDVEMAGPMLGFTFRW
jgi:hypothetical protein